MTKIFHHNRLFFLLSLVCLIAYNSSSFAQVNYALSEKLITQYKALQTPKKQPPKLAKLQNGTSEEEHTHSGFMLTPLFRQVQQNADKLSPEARLLFKSQLSGDRPKLSGTPKFLDIEHFRIHYTTNGDAIDNVSDTDTDENKIPDYVDYVRDALKKVVNDYYHSKLGLERPPSDSKLANQVKDIGGNGLYDVYLTAKETGDQTYGFVLNSHTGVVDGYRRGFSYMVLRNNFEGFKLNDEENIKVTVSHEYMHSIQFGTNPNFTVWLAEMIATWAEDVVYPNLGDNFQYLVPFLNSSDQALNLSDEERGPNNLTHYGAWIFLRYLTEQTSDDLIKQIYEHNRTKGYNQVNTELLGLGEVLKEKWQLDLETLFRDFLVSSLIFSSNEQLKPFNFKYGDIYKRYLSLRPTTQLSKEFTISAVKTTWSSFRDANGTLQRASADYIPLDFTDTVTLFLNATVPNIKFQVVQYNSEEVHTLYPEEENKSVKIVQRPSIKSVLIVYRTDFHLSESDPKSKQYDISTKRGVFTSIGEPDELLTPIRVGPVPANDLLNIFNLQIGERVRLVSLLGQTVFQATAKAGNLSIDSDRFPQGNYLLIVESEKRRTIKKIIILHD